MTDTRLQRVLRFYNRQIQAQRENQLHPRELFLVCARLCPSCALIMLERALLLFFALSWETSTFLFNSSRFDEIEKHVNSLCFDLLSRISTRFEWLNRDSFFSFAFQNFLEWEGFYLRFVLQFLLKNSEFLIF